MPFPFRFYGRSPSDWFEGGNDAHHYEIAFVRAPTNDQREILAKLFESTFAAGPARAAPAPWLWAQRFARFTLGERWSLATRALFSQAADFLREVHSVCAIEDVVFWGRREAGTGSWDQWSEAQQALPTAGPAYPSGGARREVDASLPEAAPDEPFERRREQARVALAANKAIASAKKSGLTVEAIDREALVLPRNDEAVKRIDQPDPPRDENFKLVAGHHLWEANPRVLAAKHQQGGDLVGLFLFAASGEPTAVEIPTDWPSSASYVRAAIHQDGAEGLLSVFSQVFTFDTETGKATARWTADSSVIGVRYLGDHWLIRTKTELLVIDPSGEAPVIVAKAKRKVDNGALSVARQGTIILTPDSGKTGIYGWACGKLKKLADLKIYAAAASVVDGHFVLYAPKAAWRVGGLEEAYEAWAEPLRTKASKQNR